MYILALLLACAHDPPMRPMNEIPYIAERGLAFSTEEQAFREVQRAMAMAYLEPASEAQLQLTEQAIWPTVVGGTLITRRSLTDPSHARQHMAEIGRVFLGAPFELKDWSDEDFWEAYQAFYVASLGRELGHVCSRANRSPGYDDPFVDDVRARSVEWPLLNRLAEQNRIPDRWLELYPRFLEALVKEIPPEVTASIPADSQAFAEIYRQGAAAMQDDPSSGSPEVPVMMAISLLDSLDWTRQPLRPLDSLMPDFVVTESAAPPAPMESPE